MQVVNPKSVKEVELNGAKFKIGILPYGKRTEIESSAYFNQKAETVEQMRQILLQHYETVRAGVKGHDGLTFEDGTPVPFIESKDGLVSDETMEVYSAAGILLDLSTEVRNFNYLKKETVKN